MCSTRDIVMFLAGAEAFHTLSHVVLRFSGMLPLHMCCVTWTQQLNMYAIIVNAVITGVLLWWACRLKHV